MFGDVNEFRPRMMSVAYRMLGSVADAEDAVQDAFVRYQTAADISSPEGFLIRTTTRLCIDRLRARRRQAYVGPWVPEPVDTTDRESPLAESLTQAFLLLLERLSPDERAAFLLRTVFDYEYAQVADVVGKSESTVRQLVSRARRKLGLDGERRFAVTTDQADGLAERFVEACRSGDLEAIEAMLSEEIEIHSDGGGKVSAARHVIAGKERAARFLAGVFRKFLNSYDLMPIRVNGAPGVAFFHEGRVIDVMSLSLGDQVQTVCMTLNPDKLARWSDANVD
ncbi:MAG: RNA polymerase sigma factor SigJ [Planctomycetaceae bacterium]|nr:RNA polymerase sigma factor SigJ [Planctomycetaceae bacterium]